MISQFSYPFALGVLAAVNPCGFPMLPAYLSFFIGERTAGSAATGRSAIGARLLASVRSSVAVSLGFVVVFAVLGAAFQAGLSAFMNWVPWIMVAVATGMGVIGVLGLTGRHVNVYLPHPRIGVRSASMGSMVGYGVSYAVASLTCALPLFLAGVAGSFTRSGVVTGIETFLAYAVGMAAVLTVVTVAVALTRTSILSALRRSGRHLDRVASGLLVLVALYLIDYWVNYLRDPNASSGPIALVGRLQVVLSESLDHSGAELILGVAAAALVAAAVAFRLAGGRSGAGARTDCSRAATASGGGMESDGSRRREGGTT
ncbi:MAG: cytochrome c biogenesis CcdA family protein [Acidimicrobiales bacterium]